MPGKKVDEQYMKQMAERVCNWGKWGKDDEIGTVNYVEPEDIVRAAKLVRKGKIIQMGMHFDQSGPQKGAVGRFNTMHYMTWNGSDVLNGREAFHNPAPADHDPSIPWYGNNFADDCIVLPPQCATHWDALGHMFYRDVEKNEYYMWNGKSVTNVDTTGCCLSGIDKFGGKMAGRGVLLDMARFYGVDYMEPGQGITAEDLDACAKKEGVEIRRGDYILIRTGDCDRRIQEKDWGEYTTAQPGVEFETLIWFHDKQIAAVASDTHGMELIPGRSDRYATPWHWLCLPILGMPMGENFRLDALGDDCADDGVYEFLFAAPPILITNATASPLNPYAIK